MLAAAAAAPVSPLLTGLLGFWNLEGDSRDSVSGVLATDTAIVHSAGGATFANASLSKITTALMPPIGAAVRTFSTWFNLTTINTGKHLWGYGSPSGENALNLEMWISGEVGILTHAQIFSYGSTLGAGAWHNMIVSYNGTHLGLTYDGSEQPLHAITLDTLPVFPFLIGAGPYQPNNSPNAIIRRVGVWNRLLSVDEKSGIFAAGPGGAGGSYPFI